VLDHARFEPVLDLRPIFGFQQSGFEAAQFALGGAHDVERLAGSQERDVGFAHHPAIHHPHPLGCPVFFFHHFHDVFHRGHIRPVARKHFIGKRQPLGRADQPDAHLLAVRTAVARVTPRRFRVLLGPPLKERARHVVEQELHAHPEPVPVTLDQMGAELLLVAGQHVETAIKPVLVDALLFHAEQILQRSLLIPPFGDPQLAALRAKPRRHQHAGHRRPTHRLAPRLHQFAEQFSQTQPVPQCQRQIHLPKFPHPFHPHRPNVHFFPTRRGLRGFLAKFQLSGSRPGLPAQQAFNVYPASAADVLLFEFAQPRHHSLPGPLRRANRLA